MGTNEYPVGEPMEEEDIRAAAAGELRDNRRYADDELRENWRQAYKYYKGEAPPPAQAHTSEAVSTDVSDVVEWILPAVLKPLIESPDVVRFDPVNPEDQDQADLESDYVHHVLMKKCNGFLKLYCHIKDALLLKNSVFATYWDEGICNQTEEYKNLTEMELVDLLTPADGSEVSIVSMSKREVPVLDPLTGAPLEPPPPPQAPPGPTPTPSSSPGQGGAPAPPPEPQGPPMQVLHDVTVRRITRNGKPVVENCQPEAFRVRMSHTSVDLTDAGWCAYSMVMTRAELLAQGYDPDVVDSIVSETRRYWDNEVRWEREDVEREESAIYADRNETGDPSQDPIEVHRVYMTLDTDGDGYQEKILVILGGAGGEVLLDWYEVPENPFSASTPFIAAHKFYGYSLYDKLKELADRKSKVLRMLEDNLDHVNNPRKKVINGQANLDDVLVNQVGGVWRMDSPDAVTEIPTPDVSQYAYSMLEYYDKMRGERTGTDPNAQSVTKMMPEESMNHAMERVLSMKEELVGLIIRTFAETGVKDMLCKIRGLLMRYMPREELVQLRNKWVQVNPGNWVERTNTTVVVGLGTGDRIKKIQGLGGILQVQKELAAGGFMGPLVSAERISHTIQEMIRVQGLGDPDDFVLDPRLLDPNYLGGQRERVMEAQRAMQMRQQQQQEQQRMEQAQQQAQMQQQQALLQTQMQIAQIQQQGKIQSEQLRAQSQQQIEMLKSEEARRKEQSNSLLETRKLQADMQQFMEEMRLKWAELSVSASTEQTKVAASTATALVKEGIAVDQNERQAEREDKRVADERAQNSGD